MGPLQRAMSPLEQGAHAGHRPQGSRPCSAPSAPRLQAATLLPPLQCHRLGDQDAAATAGLPSHELWAFRLPPLCTDPPGPRLRQGRLGSGWPSLFSYRLGLFGATPGYRSPSSLAPHLVLGNWVPWGRGWQTGQCEEAMPVVPLMGSATVVWHCHLPPGGWQGNLHGPGSWGRDRSHSSATASTPWVHQELSPCSATEAWSSLPSPSPSHMARLVPLGATIPQPHRARPVPVFPGLPHPPRLPRRHHQDPGSRIASCAACRALWYHLRFRDASEVALLSGGAGVGDSPR